MQGKSDFYIILGQKLVNSSLSFKCRERCFYGAELYKNNGNAKIIATGGITDDGFVSEAAAMKEYLVRLGVYSGDIITEEEALNTYQNIANSWRILQNVEYNKAIIVSSSDHIYRWSFNPVRFFNALSKTKAQYKACIDSGIAAPYEFRNEFSAVFALVRNSKNFKTFAKQNQDKNIFYKIKGTPVKDGKKNLPYDKSQIGFFVELIKKLYFIDKIDFIEI